MAFNWRPSRKVFNRRRQFGQKFKNVKAPVAAVVYTPKISSGLSSNEYSNKAMQDGGKDVSLLNCLQPLFIVGRLLQICPFNVYSKHGVPTEVAITSQGVARISGTLAKVIITAYTALLVLMEEDKTQKIPLMEYLWCYNFLLFGIHSVAVRWSMKFRWAYWVILFRKSYDIHMSFRMLGIKLHLDRLALLAKVGTAVLPVVAGAHVYFVRRAYRKGLEEHLLQSPFNFSPESTTMDVLPFVTFLFDYFAWVAQYFGDWLRFYLGLYIWTLFNALRSLVETKDEGRGGNIIKVINLHMKVVSLLGTVNKLVGVITFIACLHTLLYCCFYVNYFLSGDTVVERKLVFLFYLLRNVTIYLISADVNAKAHSLAEWLESTATAGGLDLPGNELPKLVVFSTQIYSGGTIGFKGMQFFTITSSFLAAMLSLITTYTVVITQFALEAGTANKLTKVCSGHGSSIENGTAVS